MHMDYQAGNVMDAIGRTVGRGPGRKTLTSDFSEIKTGNRKRELMSQGERSAFFGESTFGKRQGLRYDVGMD
jgi:hypothetical protein